MSGFFLYFLIISGFVSKKYISSFDFEAGDDAFMQEDNLRDNITSIFGWNLKKNDKNVGKKV